MVFGERPSSGFFETTLSVWLAVGRSVTTGFSAALTGFFSGFLSVRDNRVVSRIVGLPNERYRARFGESQLTGTDNTNLDCGTGAATFAFTRGDDLSCQGVTKNENARSQDEKMKERREDHPVPQFTLCELTRLERRCMFHYCFFKDGSVTRLTLA